MSLPYENATSGGSALEDIRKLLTMFGCQRFGTMTDAGSGGGTGWAMEFQPAR